MEPLSSHPSLNPLLRGLVTPLVTAEFDPVLLFDPILEPPKASDALVFPWEGRPIGAIRGNAAEPPALDVTEDCIEELPCTWVVGPVKKLKAAADGDGELVDPDTDGALE